MQDYLAAKAVKVFISILKGKKMDRESLGIKVGAFVSEYLSNAEVDPNLDLFTSGTVNSLFAMQLVLFVESEFGVAVANEDLDYKNFCSVTAICDFVAYKLGI